MLASVREGYAVCSKPMCCAGLQISREALGVPGPGAYSYTKPYQKIKIIEDNPDDWAD